MKFYSFIVLFVVFIVSSLEGISRVKRDENAMVMNEKIRKNFLDTHNEWRKNVNPTATNMRKMYYSYDLEKSAQLYANKCIFGHGEANDETIKYTNFGQNIFYSTSKEFNESNVVKAWNEEVKFYNFEDNSCQTGQMCGHYTQDVWWNSSLVGCGVQWCDKVVNKDVSGQIVICHYIVRGNYVNVKPYEKGNSCSNCPANTTCVDKLCEQEIDNCDKNDCNLKDKSYCACYEDISLSSSNKNKVTDSVEVSTTGKDFQNGVTSLNSNSMKIFNLFSIILLLFLHIY